MSVAIDDRHAFLRKPIRVRIELVGRSKKRLRGFEHESEPLASGDDWIEWCGHRMWVAGFTEGGAPFGLTEEEFRDSEYRAQADTGWARAKTVLLDLFDLRSEPGATIDVGYVQKIGDGLSREIFGAEVVVRDPGGRIEAGDFVVLLPKRDVDPDLDARARTEALLCARLSRLDLGFRVPTVVGALPQPRGRAVVRTFVRGIPLDLRAGRQPSVRPWVIIAEIAAELHSLETAEFRDVVGGFETCRAHAETMLREIEAIDGPELVDAASFIQEHLPPDEPSALLHGDLLGQNILLDPTEASPALIDWEYASLGDPAYDLAIVTRGARRPFQIDAGLDRLLEHYARAGGQSLQRARVHAWEIRMHARWYRDARDCGDAGRAESQLANLRSLLRRVSREP